MKRSQFNYQKCALACDPFEACPPPRNCGCCVAVSTALQFLVVLNMVVCVEDDDDILPSSEYEINWTGPSTEPCGTLHARGMGAHSLPSTEMTCVRSFRYKWNHFRACSSTITDAVNIE